MTVVEVRSDSGEEWQPVTYTDPEIDNAVSDIKVVPEASVGIADRSAVSSGDQLRFRDESDDTILFEGFVERTRPSTQGPTGVEAVHRAARLFDESVSVELESPTAEDVLQEALLQADSSGFSLNYDGTATALADAYDVENRDVKRIFRDMTERTGRVWWVGVDDTIHVEEPGARGTLASIDTATDPGVRVRDYVPDDIDTIVNDVTVRGTGGESVEGSATNAASIDEYGKQPETVNVEYIRSVGEANDYAEALLRPDPSASADVLVSNRAVDMREPVVNHTLAVTDGATGLDEELVIERQRVEQSRARVDLGEGAGVNIAKFNRSQKSDDDTTKPGSVYGNDRIATNAIDTQQLVDTAVISDKLADLSVSETKIQDGSISTPKLQAEAVTANEILAGTITALEIAAGSITANEIQTGTLTAEQVDTMFLDTDQFLVSGSGGDFEVNSKFNDFLGETVTVEFTGFGTIGHLGGNRPDIIWCGELDADVVEAGQYDVEEKLDDLEQRVSDLEDA